MKHKTKHLPTIDVPMVDNYSNGIEHRAVKRYSKMGPLVINAEPGKLSTRYNITHSKSGLKVRGFTKLTQARTALKLIFPLADWNKDHSELSNSDGLRDQIIDIARSVGN
jgi:hypothetical protein